jgi:hypothetical protein
MNVHWTDTAPHRLYAIYRYVIQDSLAYDTH